MSARMDCSALWGQAFDQIPKDTERWRKYCQILQREKLVSLASVSNSSTSTRPASAQDIIITVEALKRAADAEGSTAFGTICDKVLSTLDTVQDIGSAAAQFSPYAAVGWGALQFLVSMAVKHKGLKQFCWEAIPTLASLSHRYQTFYDVYVDSESTADSTRMLNTALIDLFVQILNFQISTVVVVKSWSEIIKSLFRDNDTIAILEDIRTKEADLQKLQLVVYQQTNTVRIKDLKETTQHLGDFVHGLSIVIQEMSQNVKHMRQAIDRDTRLKILEWISPLGYEEIHNQPSKTPQDGSANWLLRDERYKQWWYSDTSSTLWLHGFMGSGKSCVAHAVIEDIKDKTSAGLGSQECFAFYYIDSIDDKGKDGMNAIDGILRCILKQIADASGPDELLESIIKVYTKYQPKGPLTTEMCSQLISQITSSACKMTIRVDGLDEGPLNVQRQLMDYLRELNKGGSTPVKIFVTSRDQKTIQKGLDFLQPVLIDIASHNEGPIGQLIDESINKALKDPGHEELYKCDPEDQSQVVAQTLKAHAGGMFRWVTSAFDFLHDSTSFPEMAGRLETLPKLKNLYDLYDTIYQQNLQRARKSGNEIVMQTTLLFLLYRLPVHVRYEPSEPDLALREACSFARDGRLQAKYSVDDLASLCMSLVCVDRDRKSLYIPHASIREYLTSRYLEYSDKHGHAQLAALCMNFFVEVDVGYDLAEQSLGHSFASYATFHWCKHALHSQLAEPRWQPRQHSGLGTHDGKATVFRRLDMASALHSFLCESPCTIAYRRWFASWQKVEWATWTEGGEITSSLVTEPLSSINARIILRLDIEHGFFHEQGLLNVRAGVFYDGSRLSSLTFAACLGAVPAVKQLLEHRPDGGQKTSFFGITLDTVLRRVMLKIDFSWPTKFPSLYLDDSMRQILEILLEAGAKPALFASSHAILGLSDRVYLSDGDVLAIAKMLVDAGMRRMSLPADSWPLKELNSLMHARPRIAGELVQLLVHYADLDIVPGQVPEDAVSEYLAKEIPLRDYWQKQNDDFLLYRA